MGHHYLKSIRMFLGLQCVAIGIALMVLNNYGLDPISMLQQGISVQLGVSIGFAATFYNVMLILIVTVILRKKISVGTLVYTTTVGFLIDGYMHLISSIFSGPNLVMYIIGQLISCLGYALLIVSQSASSLDLIIEYVVENSKFAFARVRTFTDALFVVIGIMMGSKIHFGTLIIIITTGFFIQLYIKMLSNNLSVNIVNFKS